MAFNPGCHLQRAIVSMTAFLKLHYQVSMLLLMPLLWELWHVGRELLWPSGQVSYVKCLPKTWPFIPEIGHSWEWFGVIYIMWIWPYLLVCGQHPISSPLLQTLSSGWQLTTIGWFPAALRSRFHYLRFASLPSLLQQSAGLHPAVRPVRPTTPPRQARGALYLPVHLGYWAWLINSTSPATTAKKRKDYCFIGYVQHSCPTTKKHCARDCAFPVRHFQ